MNLQGHWNSHNEVYHPSFRCVHACYLLLYSDPFLQIILLYFFLCFQLLIAPYSG